MITKNEQEIIDQALTILKRETLSTSYVDGPSTAKKLIQLELANLEHEVFGILHLTTQHQTIDFEILFRGTIDSSAVYPREVLKAVLSKNSAAVVIAHNHPSGHSEPSLADKSITRKLFEALALIDVPVLDHLIVTRDQIFSFKESGLL